MLKFLIASALVMAPGMAWAAPPLVSDFSGTQQARMGTFGGLRLRLPLGGPARERQARAVLTVAPTLHSSDTEGALRARTGDGLEFGYRSDGQRTFSLAGHDFARSRLGAAQNADGKGDGGIPTWAIVVGGVAVAAGIGYLVFNNALNSCEDHDDEC